MNGHPDWNDRSTLTNEQVAEACSANWQSGYEAGWKAAGGGIRPQEVCPGSGKRPSKVTVRFSQGALYPNQPRKGICATCGKNLTVNSDGGMYKHRRGTPSGR